MSTTASSSQKSRNFRRRVLTPESEYPHLFPPMTELEEVRRMAFEPIVQTERARSFVNWMIEKCAELVPPGSLGENIDAVATTRATLWKIKKNDKPFHFAPKVYGDWEIGRMYADGSTQNLWEGFRNALIQLEFPGAADCDQRKSHPTSLSKELSPRTGTLIPNVEAYVDNPDEYIAQLPPGGKRLFNSLIYGSNLEYFVEKNGLCFDDPIVGFASKYQKECQVATRVLKCAMPALYEAAQVHASRKDRPNPDGTFMSWVLSHLENRSCCKHVVNAMMLGWTVIDLIFDGFISTPPYPGALDTQLPEIAAGTVHTLVHKAYV